MTTEQAVAWLRTYAKGLASEPNLAQIADLLAAKDAECKAWRAWDKAAWELVGLPPAIPGLDTQLVHAQQRCDRLEGNTKA